MRGKLVYERYSLIPQGEPSKTKLLEQCGAKSVYPLDSCLGLAGMPFKISPGAMVEIAYWAQNQASYERAQETIAKVARVDINDDTIRLVTNFVGRVVFENDCKNAEDAIRSLESGNLRFPKDRSGTLYILADGAAVNTRKKDSDGSTWRENKLGEVFSSKDIRYWTDSRGETQHQLLRKEYVSYVGAAAEFQKHLFACALRGGYGEFKETVLLSDGAAWIRTMGGELFPDAQHILDFFHLCENVNTFAKSVFGLDEQKYRPWVKDVCDALKNGKSRQILKELDPYKDNKPAGCAINLYGYIENNIDHIDYPAYLQKGFFIGSGSIESGNKTVLQDRLKRAGMRWNVRTAQYLLTLKSKKESDRWTTDVALPFLQYCLSVSRSDSIVDSSFYQ